MSLPRYAEYKDSRVASLGEVPTQWNVSKVKTVIKAIDSGVSVNAVDTPAGDESVGVLKTSCVYDGTFRFEENKAVLDEELSRVACPVEKDTIIVSRMNTPALVGAAGLVKQSRPNLFLPDRLWQVHFQGCSPDFVHYWTQSPAYRCQVEIACSGTSSSMQNLGQDQFKSFWIPLPTFDEQSAIAAFLDRETGKIDALIAEQEKLLTLLAEKRQATISHAVTRGLNPNAQMKDTGVPWVGEVAAHWKLPPLYLRYTVELGKMLDTSKITGEHLTPYLRNVDVQWDRVNTEDLPCMDIVPGDTDRFTVRDGDLLVCEGGEVGRAAVVSGLMIPIGYQKALHRLRSLAMDENPRYLFYVFRWAASTGAFAGEGQSTIAHLTGEQLRKYRFPKPPLKEQHEIAAFLDAKSLSLDSLQAEAERMVRLLKERRSALIAAAVTGKIDVRQAA